MYVTERRNEIGEKLHARFVKIQRPTLFNRVLLPVDFHFDSILPSHLFIAIFPQDTKFHHCEDVSVEILCNSMQNRFSILDNIFAFPIVTSIQNEIHQTKIHRKSLITAPLLSLCSNNSLGEEKKNLFLSRAISQ